MRIKNSSDGTYQEIAGDSGQPYSLNKVWDPIGLAWVKETQVSATSTSDATAANQVTGNNYLSSIDSKIPSSPATAANQTAANTKLDSIITNTNGLATSANQSTTLTRLGDVTEAAPASDTASSGLNGRLQRIAQRITNLITQLPSSLGQTTKANSLSVTLPIDPDLHATGSIASPDTTTVIGPLSGAGMTTAKVYISGTWAGSIVVETSEATSPAAADYGTRAVYNDSGALSVNPITANGHYTIPIGGNTKVQVRRSNAGTGTAVIELNLSNGINVVKAVSPNFNDFQATAVQGSAGTAAAGWFTKITDGTSTATVKAASTAAAAADLALVTAISPNSNQVSLGQSTGKTAVAKTGVLVTTATTADQVVLTYTVTTGKTFYWQGWDISARLTVAAGTYTYFGTASIENPSGTKLLTQEPAGTGNSFQLGNDFAEPVPCASASVIRIVCTPSAITSFTWRGNLYGYER